jgi:hypothetical protein
MAMKRREFLTLSLGTAAVAALSSRASAGAGLKEIRIGTQKGGFFPAVRQRHTVEDVFKPLGIDIKWIDFQFGPPLLGGDQRGRRRFRLCRRFAADLRAGGRRQDSLRGGCQIGRKYPGDHHPEGFADQDAG